MRDLQRILTLLLFSLVFIVSANGQPAEEPAGQVKPVRIEIPAKTTDESYRVIPCGSNGVLLFFKSIETLGDSLSKWYFSLYDQDLHQSWIKSIPLAKGMIYHEASFGNDTLSMLFLRQGKEKGSRFNLTILRLVIKSGSFISNTGNIPEETEEIEFNIFHQVAFLSYNVKSESAYVQVLQLQTGKSTIFPWSKGTVSKVSGFSFDSSNLRFRTSLSRVSSYRSRLENFLVSMDLNGKILAEIPIEPAVENRYLRGLDFLSADSSNWIIFGSYGTTPLKSSGKVKKVPESSGFFTCKLNNGQPLNINYVNLLELNNAKDLLGERDVMALKKKALKKNRNLSEYSLDYPLLMHKVFRHKDQFILLSETFSPQYHPESFTDYDFYGRPYVNTYDVFDGYRFNNGIITAFSKDGKLIWDNTLEIRNLLSYELTPKITVFFTPDDDAVLTYLSEGKIASKIIRENKVIEKLDFNPIEMLNPEDKLIAESKSGLLAWYDNFFLCYGFQEIKNIKLGENKKRLVFYFTKIAFN